ncbi:MAG TPA: Fe-S cluster assembly protein SufD [Tahibacter sp.]|uniref:Fe-S cluster assembly protein SufD n=1 Tax=Tahibacter sp. TaxID=2056211 RepID=UPI002B967DE5|nr:Fe-S cluster assembly protein SufD [Tahibacter sp.]HSX61142.1 Fe-S cluster assembly protein SufD [Tahibacter sp.]
MSAPLLLQEFERGFAALAPAQRDAAGLGESRRAQLAAALADGLPGARAERWRNTSLRALERRAFSPLPAQAEIDAGVLAAIPAPRIVFVNGAFAPALSQLDAVPDGVSVVPLSQALAGGDAREVEFLARRFGAADETFARLNAAFAQDGLLLRVAADVQCATPVALVLLGAGGNGEHAVHLRHHIELGDGARLTLCEYQLAATPQAHLVNGLAHVHLRRGARLDHVRVQSEDASATLLTRTDAVLGSDADYHRIDLELGANLSRHELNVALQGNGARLSANGVLLADGRRHVDTRLAIDHIARDTACQLNWRGLGADRGRAVFHGGITIRAGADGTAAHLSNKNLLLSANAEIDTQPVLEIHADEVQASHGATVGQLDETALFYLRSRGVPEHEARTVLTLAFCRVVLDGIGDEALRERVDALLSARLPRVGA